MERSTQETSWRETCARKAAEQLAAAKALLPLSGSAAEVAAANFTLGDPYAYGLELAPRDFGHGADEAGREAAALLLEAARNFRAAGDYASAYSTFLLAHCAAREIAGPQFEQMEAESIHGLAEIHLTAAECSTDPELKLAERVKAAALTELEAVLHRRYHSAEAASRAFDAAASGYFDHGEYERAARAASNAGMLSRETGQCRSAAESFLLASRALQRAAVADPAANWPAVEALLNAGRDFSDDSALLPEAAQAFLDAGELALRLPSSPERSPQLEARLADARRYFEELGEFEFADRAVRVVGRLRCARFRAAAGGRWSAGAALCSALDLVWGYGTRPCRLFVPAGILVAASALAYTLAGDLAWARLPGGAPAGVQGLVAVAFSLVSVFPTQLVKELTDVQLLPFSVGLASSRLALVENLLALPLWTMALWSLVRWFRRRFHPAG